MAWCKNSIFCVIEKVKLSRSYNAVMNSVFTARRSEFSFYHAKRFNFFFLVFCNFPDQTAVGEYDERGGGGFFLARDIPYIFYSMLSSRTCLSISRTKCINKHYTRCSKNVFKTNSWNSRIICQREKHVLLWKILIKSCFFRFL